MRRLNLALRLFQCAGIFISCFFYVTTKVLILNLLTVLICVVTFILQYNFESSNQDRSDLWASDAEKYGSSPIWIYVVAAVSTVVGAILVFLLRE